MTSTKRQSGGRRHWVMPAIIIGVTLLVAATLVGLSLRRPPIDAFTPTTPFPAEVGDRVANRQYTVDATGSGAWVAFDFSRGSAVAVGDPGGWDIAFRRFNVMTNGGPGFGGNAGVVDLGGVAFDSVMRVPESGYVMGAAGRSDSTNAAIDRWYDYGFTSHILRSKRNVYAVRTADGRYAKLQIMSYYCPGAVPGCITFRYVYQGGGGTDVSVPAGPAESGPTG